MLNDPQTLFALVCGGSLHVLGLSNRQCMFVPCAMCFTHARPLPTTACVVRRYLKARFLKLSDDRDAFECAQSPKNCAEHVKSSIIYYIKLQCPFVCTPPFFDTTVRPRTYLDR